MNLFKGSRFKILNEIISLFNRVFFGIITYEFVGGRLVNYWRKRYDCRFIRRRFAT